MDAFDFINDYNFDRNIKMADLNLGTRSECTYYVKYKRHDDAYIIHVPNLMSLRIEICRPETLNALTLRALVALVLEIPTPIAIPSPLVRSMASG